MTAVALSRHPVRISAKVAARIRTARDTVDRCAAGDTPIYGLTTGLGAAVDTSLTPQDRAEFQRRAIDARSVGVGGVLSTADVRAMMFARLSGLAQGGSGISLTVAERLADCLNAGVHPLVPSIGSIGAADLSHLAHMTELLVGSDTADAEYGGQRLSCRAALSAAGLEPVTLGPKDGLALFNANAASVGLGALALQEANHLWNAMSAAGALSLEAFRGNLSPLAEEIIARRPAPGQQAAAARLRQLLAGSQLFKTGTARRVQDPLSFRCIAPVHGAATIALEQAVAIVESELNSAGDNPLVLPEQNAIVSNANFDVTALALAFETLGLAAAHCANISLGRTCKHMSPEFSDLPRFLTRHGGSRNGFATAQKTGAALEARIRHAALPIGLHTAPVANGVEDYAPMTFETVRKFYGLLRDLRLLVALELLVAAQAFDLRQVKSAGRGVLALHQLIRADIAELDEDRPIGPDIERLDTIIASGAISRLIKALPI